MLQATQPGMLGAMPELILSNCVHTQTYTLGVETHNKFNFDFRVSRPQGFWPGLLALCVRYSEKYTRLYLLVWQWTAVVSTNAHRDPHEQGWVGTIPSLLCRAKTLYLSERK